MRFIVLEYTDTRKGLFAHARKGNQGVPRRAPQEAGF